MTQEETEVKDAAWRAVLALENGHFPLMLALRYGSEQNARDARRYFAEAVAALDALFAKDAEPARVEA